MTWQRRSNGDYYYRSRRDGGRVTHDYFGTGPAAQVVASMDATERADRQAHADAKAAVRKPFAQADGSVRRLIAASEELVHMVLLSEGFYRHDRGPWRRRNRAYVRLSNP